VDRNWMPKLMVRIQDAETAGSQDPAIRNNGLFIRFEYFEYCDYESTSIYIDYQNVRRTPWCLHERWR